MVRLFATLLGFLLMSLGMIAHATRVTTNVYDKSDGTLEVTMTHSIAGTSINAVWAG
jgi:hypothetical protein